MYTPLFYLSTLLLGLSSLLSVNAADLIVFSPRILTPTASTVWLAGNIEEVTWETDNIPEEAQGYNVTVFLGRLTEDSENLNTTNPLASGVSILSGTAIFMLPNTTVAGENYIVALLGDSGNISNEFKITTN